MLRIPSCISKYKSVAAAAAVVLSSGCATTSASDRSSGESILGPATGYIIEVEARGRPLRLKVDPGAPFFVLLNDTVARNLALVSTRTAILTVGPMRVRGKTRNEKLTIAGVTAAKPVMWFAGYSIPDADGVINPAHLPSERTTLQLGDAKPGEQVIELPMRFDQERGLYHEFDYGQHLILTRLTLEDELTTTTGAAASVIAKRRAGLWHGGVFTHKVRFSIPRPVRRMVLGEALSIRGFPLSSFAVRVNDDRGSHRLPDKDAELPQPHADKHDIVVSKKSKRTFGAPHFWLMIGSKDLSRCSRISYDRGAKRLTLRCSIAGRSS